MHVIVGQGQLDTVLRATPEERRGFIEEAAGVLKHRRRKERALRKLETMELNLTRVQDLTGEIRRQLGPLGRQAEAARRAAVIQADARDARLRLLADDLVQLTGVLEQEVADETALLERRTAVEDALADVRQRLSDVERRSAEAAPELTRAHDRFVRLQSLRDRMESTGSVAAERVRLLSQDEEHEATSGRDPEELRAQAAQAREAEAALLAEVATATEELAAAVAAREEAEAAYAAEQGRLARLARAAADRREGLAKLAGQVGARRSRIEAGEAEIGRLSELVAAARARAAAAEQEFNRLEGGVAVEEEGEEGLDDAYESAAARLAEAEAEIERLVTAEREAERDRSSATARIEALELSLRRKDGAATLLAAADTEHAVVGTVAALLQVTGGHEAAVAAALGWASEALAVPSADHAARAIASLRDNDGGRAALLVGATASPSDPATWPALDGSAVWARDVVRAPDSVRPAVEQLLERVALVPTAAHAVALVSRGEGITAVTADGDVFGPGWARGGSSAGESLLELQAAVDETRTTLDAATARAERARFALGAARDRARDVAAEVEAALEALHESDARMAAVAEQLGGLGAAMRQASAEADRTERAITEARLALERDRTELEGLSARLAEAEAAPAEEGEDPSTDERDRLELAASRARTAETELRLTLRTREERARALKGRADSLEGAARNELAARERLRERRERRRREATVAAAVHAAASYAVERVALALALATTRRDAAEAERLAREQAGVALRARAARRAGRPARPHRHRPPRRDGPGPPGRPHRAAAGQGHRGARHRPRGARRGVRAAPGGAARQRARRRPGCRARAGALRARGAGEAAAQGRARAAGPRPGQPAGAGGVRGARGAAHLPHHPARGPQALQARPARHRQGGRRARRAGVHRGVPRHREQFERVFERLFPGGEGRLILTDPDDMLTTGIEVEARPPGKKVKRLSLLSGGERSLVAVALLVAIFKARPSPFYIMDEVEAALDDTNLGRLITLFEELRDSSQLIVITHQKRTMEVADALYGVSMRGDGVTTVVSQRIRDVAATA